MDPIQDEPFHQTLFTLQPSPSPSSFPSLAPPSAQVPFQPSSPSSQPAPVAKPQYQYQAQGRPNQNNYNNNNNRQQRHQQEQQRPQQSSKAGWAATQLGSDSQDLHFFDEYDPLNPANKLTGFVCRKTDKVLITDVNGPLASPLVLLSAPPPAHAFQQDTFIPQLPANCTRYFISYKWNGQRVTVFKYTDCEGRVFVSARPRSFPFLRDTAQSKQLSLFKDCLAKIEPPVPLPLSIESLPPAFFPLNFEAQSITCELFGSNIPHLINYPFDAQLKTLYYTHNEHGGICPISEIEAGLAIAPTDTEDMIEQTLSTAVEAGLGLYCGPIAFEHQPTHISSLESVCRLLKKKAHEMNAAHRRNITDSSLLNFIIEGWVLHLLDENGLSINRSMYLVQPEDVRQTKWEQFNTAAQKQVLEAYQKLHARGGTVPPAAFQRELGLSSYQWARWNRDILGLIDGIPVPRNVAQRPKDAQQMILLTGIPGSGKSTFARKLRGWERCNQDELGNRKQVENAVASALKNGKNVVVDRCNFDYTQRHTWVKLASSFGVQWITCIILRTDPEECKKRVSVREGHQTIPSGDAGFVIIDKFKDLWVEPHHAEGFCEIIEVTTELQNENLVQRLTIEHLENKVDGMATTISQLRKKVAELEAKARQAKQAAQSISNNPYHIDD